MVEREIELSAEKLERSLFFKTISMKETQKWNEDEDEKRKDFSIFDSSISDRDQDSAYIKKTLSRVRRDKVLLQVKVEDFQKNVFSKSLTQVASRTRTM